MESEGTPATTNIILDGKKLDTVQRIEFRATLKSVFCRLEQAMVDDKGKIVVQSGTIQLEHKRAF